MRISRLTALIIATNEVDCRSAGPSKDGRWKGWILKRVERWEPLLETDYFYSSNCAAVKAMEDLVVEIRKFVDSEGGAAKVVEDTLAIDSGK